MVVLLTESTSLLGDKIAKLPSLLEITIPSPNLEQRLHCFNWYVDQQPAEKKPKFWSTPEEFAKYTAGLSVQALLQILKQGSYENKIINPVDLIDKVEVFVKSQLGEHVVEFKRPIHTFNEVVGISRIKEYIRNEFIPDIKDGLIVGVTVAGAIGAGKTYPFEAIASYLGIPVFVLKDIRSMWYGQTDVILERLKRLLSALDKCIIFVDEADVQFGGVGKDTHETERRLTGTIQGMISDITLRGKVVWFQITARIYNLSEDLLRPGRCGDVIFAMTDPIGKDREEFIKWVIKAATDKADDAVFAELDEKTKGYSSADFDKLKRKLKSKRNRVGRSLEKEEILGVVKTIIPPANTIFRRIQTLHALLRCNDTRLLPEDYEDVAAKRKEWREELDNLEAIHGRAS
jgi:SpoVK/Ycf46/Vps4 family AAA+-type ATPase